MSENVNDTTIKIVNSIVAHGADVRNVIGSASDKLAREIEKLQIAVLQVAQAREDRPSLITYHLRLQNLTLAFKPCMDICLNASAEGRALNDDDFKMIVKKWYECKQQEYFNVLSESGRLLISDESLGKVFQRLKADGLKIDEEISKVSRNDLIVALKAFDDDLHILLSSIGLRLETKDAYPTSKDCIGESGK